MDEFLLVVRLEIVRRLIPNAAGFINQKPRILDIRTDMIEVPPLLPRKLLATIATQGATERLSGIPDIKP